VAQLLLIADEVDEALAHIAHSEIVPEKQLATPIYHLREMTRSLRHARTATRRVAGSATIADDEAITEELADIVIRVLSYSGGNGLPLGQAILRKMAINETRELRHGKQF
jgi:NTP pyrophosphatase (non-canonical NTP hydrolase)